VLVELESNATGISSRSWATRLRRDDLLTFQIDGSKGSAVAGLHKCRTQTNTQTPHTAHFSIAKDLDIDYRSQWTEVADARPYKNPYRVGWEDFLRHIATGVSMKSDFAAGIRDVHSPKLSIVAPGKRCGSTSPSSRNRYIDRAWPRHRACTRTRGL
jgi:predicted dehydrogenase